jgi:hypothetical protein
MLFALVGCGGCGNPEAGPRAKSAPGICDRIYIVSAEFTPAERAHIERANERWNIFGIEHYCLTTGENVIHGIRKLHAGSPEQIEMSQAAGSNVQGSYTRELDRVFLIDNAATAELFEQITLHELGHSRGLKHVGGKAVMSGESGQAYEFTEADFRECVRAGACAGTAP